MFWNCEMEFFPCEILDPEAALLDGFIVMFLGPFN